MALQSPGQNKLRPLVVIGLIVLVAAGLFGYTGWWAPRHVTSKKLVEVFAPPGGPALGHRRNHAKGICFTGTFEANGNGQALSSAPMFQRGEYPIIGRFNLGSPELSATDASVRVRGMGLQIAASNGQLWRTAMINAPVFAAANPDAFYDLLVASKSKEADAMKNYIAAHPEFGAFLAWAKSAPWTGSYAEETYNSLNSFEFTASNGTKHIVRWSLLPQSPVTNLSTADLAQRPADFLEQEITERINRGPARWTMQVTVATQEDPVNDPTKAWPKDRQTIDVGTLVVQQIEPEQNGPCRDLNYDPTVLPTGMAVSSDPFPAARSAVYRRSYDLRASEEKYYPEGKSGVQP
ncbi:catalase family peroxidase [Dyella japonica]|uniref:Catalase-related peroxidase n=1 Tax=Dyella japonica TaxID=231455 RepID=A0ABV2JRV1_9GAMM